MLRRRKTGSIVEGSTGNGVCRKKFDDGIEAGKEYHGVDGVNKQKILRSQSLQSERESEGTYGDRTLIKNEKNNPSEWLTRSFHTVENSKKSVY